MSGSEIDGASVAVNTSYHMQQLQAHCDTSLLGYNVNQSIQWFSLGFFWNVSKAIVSLPFAMLRNAYHYFTEENLVKEEACDLVLNYPIESFDKTDVLGRNYLGQAISKSFSESAKVFALAGVNLSQRDFVQFSHILHSIASQGDFELLNFILNQGRAVDVNAVDQNGMTPLHLSALFDQPKTFELLLKANADPNLIDHFKRTCALLAAQNSTQNFELLMSYDVKLNIKDHEYKSIWHYAAQNKNPTPVMKTLYAKGIPIDQIDLNGQTAMHIAAATGNEKAIENLAYYKFSIDKKDKWGMTPIHYAAMNGHVNAINKLISYQANVNDLAPNMNKSIIGDHGKLILGPFEETPLMIAARNGQSGAVQALIDNNADVHVQTSQNESALTFAVKQGDFLTVEKLIAAKADVNHISASGMSLCYIAYKEGNEKIASLLAQNQGKIQAGLTDKTRLNEAVCAKDFLKAQTLMLQGALLNARDYEDQTPLMIAARLGDIQMLQSLISAGVTSTDKGMLYILDIENRQAIHFAALSNNVDVIKKLLASGATHLAFDVNMQLPIHYAVKESKIENLRLLADLNYPLPMGVDIMDVNKQTPLLMAVSNNDLKAAQILLEKGASPELMNKEGKSAYHLAAINGNASLMQLLLENSLKGINWTDKEGHSPLYYAVNKGYNDVADLLMEKGALITSQKYDDLQLAVLKNEADRVAEYLDSSFPIVKTVGDQTIFHLNAKIGNAKISRMLQDHMNETLIDYQDIEGNTALILDAKYNRTEDLIELIHNQANIEAKNNNGETATHLAAQNGNNKALWALALAGANLEEPLPNGLTPLALASMQDQESSCKLLVEEFYVNPKKMVSRDKVSKSCALLNLVYAGDFERLQKFLLQGANTAVTDEDGWTALHAAVVPSVPIKILESLIDAGLDLNAKDKSNATPLVLAAAFQNLGAIQMLLEKSAEIEQNQREWLLRIIEESSNEKLKEIIAKNLAKK